MQTLLITKNIFRVAQDFGNKIPLTKKSRNTEVLITFLKLWKNEEFHRYFV